MTMMRNGSSIAKGYDGLGLHISATDEEGRVTQYMYDAGSQLTRVTDALNQQTQYAYDLAGNKISQTDALGRVTTYTFDALNRRTSRTLPLGQVERMTYDAVGNGVTKTDFNGEVTTYAFDSLNRLLSKTPDASFTGAPPVAFSYTGTGRRATMSDASGATNYGYDARDRMVLKTTPQGSLTYAFDLAGNVLSVVSSNQNGTNTGYAYDANNRLSGVTDNAGGGTTSYVYDATNQMLSTTYPNGVVHANTFDARDRVTALVVSRAGAPIANYGQTYRVTSHRSGVVENTGRTMSYAYDPIYRLTSETIAGNANAVLNGALTYGLDAVGNRLSLTSTLAALSSQSLSYDANDRLAVDTYDANGNTVASGGKAFAYEFEDRLTSYDNGTVTYVYDGDGNRVARTVAGSTVRYLMDEQNPTGYVQVAEEVAAGLVIAQYVHGPQRISLRQSVSGTWGKSYYGYDAFGTTRALLDAAGAVTDTWTFDGFGNVVDRTGSTPNQYLYRGEALDAGTGMYYLRARWYRPEVGRFLTGDTFEPVTTGDEDITLYNFTRSDPINSTDPSGMLNVGEYGIISGKTSFMTKIVAASTAVVLGVGTVSNTYEILWEPTTGKIHAQGSDFGRNPLEKGTGLSLKFSSPATYPRYAIILDVHALMWTLEKPQLLNRLKAFEELLDFLKSPGPKDSFMELSFPKNIRRESANLPSKACRQALDCRVDFQIFTGRVL
jgi:RHS repeat-associated protein